MRVLIVSTNRTLQPTPVIPYGACLVASLLQEKGYDVSFLDLAFVGNPKKALARKIQEAQPDVVGLSVRNIDNFDGLRTQSYSSLISDLCSIVRENAPNAKMLLGGPAVGFYPEAYLKLTGADALYIGDAESKLVETIEQLHRSELKEKVINAVGTSDFSKGVRARVWKWVDIGAYHKTQVGIPVQMKRGCGRACSHCINHLVLEGPRVRARLIDDALDEVEEIIDTTKSPYIEILDTLLNYPVDYLADFCRRAIERGVKAKFQSTNFWPMGFTEELHDLMVRAGFYSLCVAAESASDPILKELNRGYCRKDLEHTARLLENSPLNLFWMFMIGAPSEAAETIQESFQFIDCFVRPRDMVFWNCGMRVHASTALARRFPVQGDLFEPTFFQPAGIGFQAMVDLLEAHCLERPNAIVSSEADFARRLFAVLRRFGADPPYWRFAYYPNRYLLNPLMRTMRALHLNKRVRRLKAQ